MTNALVTPLRRWRRWWRWRWQRLLLVLCVPCLLVLQRGHHLLCAIQQWRLHLQHTMAPASVSRLHCTPASLPAAGTTNATPSTCIHVIIKPCSLPPPLSLSLRLRCRCRHSSCTNTIAIPHPSFSSIGPRAPSGPRRTTRPFLGSVSWLPQVTLPGSLRGPPVSRVCKGVLACVCACKGQVGQRKGLFSGQENITIVMAIYLSQLLVSFH